jgi:hypothetical protein
MARDKLPVKKDETVDEDDLRPEYEMELLTVRRLGPARTSYAGKVVGEPCVAVQEQPTQAV